MRCYYQIEDGEWIKGFVDSLSGGRETNFHSRDEDGTVKNSITLWHPEILFNSRGFTITGFVPSTDHTYKLIAVDVALDVRHTKG